MEVVVVVVVGGGGLMEKMTDTEKACVEIRGLLVCCSLAKLLVTLQLSCRSQ